MTAVRRERVAPRSQRMALALAARARSSRAPHRVRESDRSLAIQQGEELFGVYGHEYWLSRRGKRSAGTELDLEMLAQRRRQQADALLAIGRDYAPEMSELASLVQGGGIES